MDQLLHRERLEPHARLFPRRRLQKSLLQEAHPLHSERMGLLDLLSWRHLYLGCQEARKVLRLRYDQLSAQRDREDQSHERNSSQTSPWPYGGPFVD